MKKRIWRSRENRKKERKNKDTKEQDHKEENVDDEVGGKKHEEEDVEIKEVWIEEDADE